MKTFREYSMADEFFEYMKSEDTSMFRQLDDALKSEIPERFYKSKDFKLPTKRIYISDEEFEQFIANLENKYK